MQTSSQRVQKMVTLSPVLYKLAEKKAKSLGIHFPEYIRHLLINDVEEDLEPIETVDAETDKRIGESLKAYKEGRYTTVHTEEELDKFLGIEWFRMYTLTFTEPFKEHYDHLVKKDPSLRKRMKKALQLLENDPKHPSLKSHQVNTLNYGIKWSARVTGDLRVIWEYDKENRLTLLLLEIGGHSGKYKVYK